MLAFLLVLFDSMFLCDLIVQSKIYSPVFYSFYKFLFTYILFRFHSKITGLIQVFIKIYIHTRVQTCDCIKVESTECSYKLLSRLDTDMAAMAVILAGDTASG